MEFFSWPKFEGCWNYHMIPVHSRAGSILFFTSYQGFEKRQNSLKLFCLLATIFLLIYPLFSLSWENGHCFTYMWM